MFLNFTAGNFRSIRNELTLSMSAGRFRSNAGSRAFESGFAQSPCVLRTAAIYGANAAGKSTIVAAIDFLQDFVMDSVKDEAGVMLKRVKPYAYDSPNSDGVSSVEIAFISKNVLYTYGFSFDRDKIHDEWLHSKTKEGRTREVYSRFLENSEYEWHFSPIFKSKRMVSTWRDACRDNALFLTTAIGLNCEELDDAFQWITHSLRVFSSGRNVAPNVTSEIIIEDPEAKDEIIELLRWADPTIVDVSVKEKSIDNSDVLSMFTEKFRRELMEAGKDIKSYEVEFTHRRAGGQVAVIPFDQQSDGTRMLYRYAAPFLRSVENGFVMVVDELDRSLHPLLLQSLVSMFVNPRDLSTRAQLIFTTHDTALMSSELLAPDQVWFAENHNGRGTELIPLADYKPRKGEAVQKAYLHGRYGAVPPSRAKAIPHAK